MDSQTKKFLSQSPILHIRKLSVKSLKIPGRGREKDCLHYLAMHANVTCIIGYARETVDHFIATNVGKELEIKVLQEALAYSLKTWIAKYASSYLDRFNEVISKAFESGLLENNLNSKVNELSKIVPPEEIGKEKLFLI